MQSPVQPQRAGSLSSLISNNSEGNCKFSLYKLCLSRSSFDLDRHVNTHLPKNSKSVLWKLDANHPNTQSIHLYKSLTFIVTSSIYGQLLVVVCLAFFTAEIVTPKIPLFYFEDLSLQTGKSLIKLEKQTDLTLQYFYESVVLSLDSELWFTTDSNLAHTLRFPTLLPAILYFWELKSGTSHAFLEELILPLRNQISRGRSRSLHDSFITEAPVNTSSTTTTINRSNPCQKENIMGTILSDASPYLYPFIVEYSLIGAAFLYVMWSTIGKGKRNNLCNGNDSTSTPTSPIGVGLQVDNLSTTSSNTYSSNSPALYSCLGSSKGLFSGFLFLAISVTSLIIFFVLVHNPNYKLMATLISDISHSVLLILSCAAILLGFIKTRRLKFQPGVSETADGGLRDLLLRVAAFGLYTYSLFGVIAGSMELNSIRHLLVLVTSTLTIVQITLQSLFISDVVCRKRNSHKQPGRQLITFLLINNLTLWIVYTFEMQKVEASPVQLSIPFRDHFR
ncbi:unnamed protein product [Oppiella nova]|uniref:Uncharacterized protein n=1 Tax=Oppiella nova TaxID=334625 RepID=A0A7R9QK11_9ACAR|nr:unnamed protein product [Oppiella nova]CAG2167480.1 unnamed protein product [Oppiella nova]